MHITLEGSNVHRMACPLTPRFFIRSLLDLIRLFSFPSSIVYSFKISSCHIPIAFLDDVELDDANMMPSPYLRPER